MVASVVNSKQIRLPYQQHSSPKGVKFEVEKKDWKRRKVLSPSSQLFSFYLQVLSSIYHLLVKSCRVFENSRKSRSTLRKAIHFSFRQKKSIKRNSGKLLLYLLEGTRTSEDPCPSHKWTNASSFLRIAFAFFLPLLFTQLEEGPLKYFYFKGKKQVLIANCLFFWPKLLTAKYWHCSLFAALLPDLLQFLFVVSQGTQVLLVSVTTIFEGRLLV